MLIRKDVSLLESGEQRYIKAVIIIIIIIIIKYIYTAYARRNYTTYARRNYTAYAKDALWRTILTYRPLPLLGPALPAAFPCAWWSLADQVQF